MVSHSVTKVGIELLAALKSNSFFREQEPGGRLQLFCKFSIFLLFVYMTCVRKTLYGDGSESWESTDLCQHKNHIRLLSFTSCCRLVFYFYHKGFNLKKHAILNWKMQMLQQDFSLICGVVGLLYAQRDVILNLLYSTKSQLLYSKISNLGSPGEEMFFWRKQSNISSVIWRFFVFVRWICGFVEDESGIGRGAGDLGNQLCFVASTRSRSRQLATNYLFIIFIIIVAIIIIRVAPFWNVLFPYMGITC